MLTLTKENIRTITETIDKAEISFSHLREDLIDHVCCEVENKLSAGVNFQQAFDKIKSNLGINVLRRVQEQTILNIDKNYCLMKNVMKISGSVSTTLLMFGTLFKINHWPGASIVLTLGFVLLCFLFLPSATYVMHKANKVKGRVMLYLTAFLGSFGFILGILFKIQHWPWGANLLILGIGILCLLFFPTLLIYLLRTAKNQVEKRIYVFSIFSAIVYLLGLLFKMVHWPGGTITLTVGSLLLAVLFLSFYCWYRFKEEKFIKPGFIYIIVAFTWFIFFTMLISLGVSNDVGKGFGQIETENQLMLVSYQQKCDETISNYQNSEFSSVMVQINSSSDDVFEFMEEIKNQINRKVEEANEEASEKGLTIKMDAPYNWNNFEIPTSIMMGWETDGVATELKQKLDMLNEKYISYIEENDELSELIKKLLNTSVPEGSPEWANTWEKLYFERVNVAGCMNILTFYQRNIRIAEYEMLQHIISDTKLTEKKAISANSSVQF